MLSFLVISLVINSLLSVLETAELEAGLCSNFNGAKKIVMPRYLS